MFKYLMLNFIFNLVLHCVYMAIPVIAMYCIIDVYSQLAGHLQYGCLNQKHLCKYTGGQPYVHLPHDHNYISKKCLGMYLGDY